MCDLLKTFAGEISDFFFSLSSHKKILRNTWLMPIWSMEKCSAMPAVHQKVDVDGVFSAWVRETLAKYRVRMQQKTRENTLENNVFVGKMLL